MTENQLQKKMIHALKLAGFMVRKINAENSRGWPDLVVIGHGVTAFIEVKIPTGKVSVIQEKTLLEIKRHGGYVNVWWGFDGCKQFIRETTGRG